MRGTGSARKERWVIRGRKITSEDLVKLPQLVAEFRALGRWRIAIELAKHWQWRASSGRLKSRSCLAILVELERRGYFQLPAPLKGAAAPRVHQAQEWEAVIPLELKVGQLRPFCWRRVAGAAQGHTWRGVMDQFHYLGAPAMVGAHLKYLVFSQQGQLLGAVGWQSAVEHLGCRDRLVGWDAQQRARFLERVVNQVRFLVLPGLYVRHLASALLGESIQVLQRDWPRHYGLDAWLLESFVDRTRFSGACYRAANWMPIGWSRGFAKRQGEFIYHGQPKEVYVYVLEASMRQRVHEDVSQPLLTRPFLLAQRLWEEEQTQPKRKRMKAIQESWTPKVAPQWNLSQSDLACVGQELSEFTGMFRQTFGRIECYELCALYLQGLLSPTRRKNVEAMALKLKGPSQVRNLQRFIGEYKWEDDWLRQEHWKLCAQALDDPQGVWSIDASEFAKKGNDSVGVAPQYCGSLGKTANCQCGVFVCYSGAKGHALLDSRLYLPQSWFQEDYAQRRKKCHIPEQVQFQTKPQLALELFQPLWQSGLFRGHWITMDCSFGNNEAFLEKLPSGCNYLAEIPCTRKVWVKKSPKHPQLQAEGGTVEDLLEAKDLLQWSSHKVAEGDKGPIVAAFARIRVYLSADRSPESERWLLLRNGPDGKIKYALSNAPQQTTLKRLIRVSAARWPIERCFQEDKSELGLDHYEHRSWLAWHRHMRLVFLAQLFLLRLRLKYKKSPSTDLASSSPAIGVVPARSRPGAGPPHPSPALPPTAQLPSL